MVPDFENRCEKWIGTGYTCQVASAWRFEEWNIGVVCVAVSHDGLETTHIGSDVGDHDSSSEDEPSQQVTTK